MKSAQTFPEYLTRYLFAMEYCGKKRVLDAGSKDGYGARLISYVTRNIDLADICETYLNIAKRRGGLDKNAKFFVNDFEKEFPDGEWDVIIAFEVIEHLANPDFFLDNVNKHLSREGVFIFSVPHIMPSSLHKQLFDKESIITLISKYFTLMEFYEQTTKPISNRFLYKKLKVYVGVAVKKPPKML